ncbi:formylmethanofuran dehydrogenase subunit C [Thiosocius teredinicola]|uniref:formylmethanofuran dehydrogenase subunit C n=1 Tax=Thiosocius teredinicola TaxID=1973002 RepID=UPI000F77ECC2
MKVTLRQQQPSAQRIDMRGVTPERLAGLDETELQRIELCSGKRRLALGDVFSVSTESTSDDVLEIVPLDDRLDFLGAGMNAGTLIVQGDAGDYAGRAMGGGRLDIRGNAGDYAGSALAGGALSITGNAGDFVGAPMGGERRGQQGGLIYVRGNAGKRAGERQRRGYLIIEGSVGELLAHRMIAGTAYVGGHVGPLACHGMQRGSVVVHEVPAGLSSTIAGNGHCDLPFVTMLLTELQRLSDGGLPLGNGSQVTQRLLGDLAENGRGEILVVSRAA